MCLSATVVAQNRPLPLRIYVYNSAGVPAAVLTRAENRAHEIFSQSGIDTNWDNCAVHDKEGTDCSGKLPPDIIVVHIVENTERLGQEVFGAAFLGTSGHGSYADVFFDRVEGLCWESKLSLPDMIGHVIAHEIGHLLLGFGAHSPFGIMRGKWQPQELQQVGRGGLFFSAEQSKTMRQRLIAISSGTVAEVTGGQ